MPKQKTVVRDDDIEEIIDNSGSVIGYKCAGGFPFTGENAYNQAIEQKRMLNRCKDK